MNDPRYRSSFGFIDLLFNLLIGFVFLFMLAFMLINPVAKKETIKPKAEYFIILEWDGEKPYDLDLWVKDNLGHVVSFRRPDDALIHLERDDLGTINDTYYDPDLDKLYQYVKLGDYPPEWIDTTPYKEDDFFSSFGY